MKTLGLKGKKILVTGIDGFLGIRLSRALSDEGAYTIGTDVKESMTASEMDISDPASVYNYFGSIKTLEGQLDGIINNAAVSFKGNETDPTKFSQTMDVNAKGTYNCITQALGKDILSKDASIVNVASIYGILSPDFRIYEGNKNLYSSSAYGASKAAIIQMTKYYAVQLAPIRVNAVSPGGIFQGHNDNFSERYSERVPLKRMADPEEIVNVILFLLSPLSSYITGTNIVVDGGMSAW